MDGGTWTWRVALVRLKRVVPGNTNAATIRDSDGIGVWRGRGHGQKGAISRSGSVGHAVLFVGDEVAIGEPILELLFDATFLANAATDGAIGLLDAPAVEVVGAAVLAVSFTA